MRIHIAKAMAAACVLSSSAVFAADLPPVAPVEPVVALDWTGFHIGVHGGLAAGDFNYPFHASYYDYLNLDGEAEITASGGFAGVSVGGDYQWDNFVLGVVGDAQWSGYEGELSIEGSIEDLGSAEIEAGSSLEWFATVRGRVGFVWDRALIYGTGGVAFGEIESGYSASISDDEGNSESLSDSVKTDHVGWTVGAGIEYMLTNNVSFKTEYLYIDFGDEEIIGFSDEGISAGLDVETQFHTIKAGVSYRF